MLIGEIIISRNLRQGHGEFNPVAKGKKINAIFGFCDIRNFTDLCEVLRQETMVFTNKVAEIVHNECHRADGDVNKNIGDAFLSANFNSDHIQKIWSTVGAK